jgi:hypothetical protein
MMKEPIILKVEKNDCLFYLDVVTGASCFQRFDFAKLKTFLVYLLYSVDVVVFDV